MSDSFLQKLSGHPIFRGSSSEFDVTSSLSSDSSTSTSSSSSSYQNKGNKKIVSRGDDELFIANGKSIRCCDTNSVTNRYKLLKVVGEDLKFDIHRLQINDSGTLLAAYNDSELVVYSLPSPGFMDNYKEETIPVKSYVIGRSILGGKNNNVILDLCWNSIARFDSELVILSSNCHLTTFDLTISSDSPQFVLNLAHNVRGGFGLLNTVVDPVSISFGSSNQGTPSLCLTLYVLSGDGDVYALYPFVPTCLAVTQSFVRKLFDETALYFRDVELQQLLSSRRMDILQQLKYVSMLFKDMEKAQREIKLDLDGNVEQLYHLEPPTISESLKVQGPFRIAPFPDILYNYDGCEIDHVPCGDTDVIITSWSNGSCLVLFQDQELIMRWKDINRDEVESFQLDEDDYDGNCLNDDDDITDPELTLSTLQYIPLTRNDPISIRLAGSCSLLAPFQYFIVLNDSKLIQIDFKLWGEQLNNAIKLGDPSLLMDVLSDSSSSTSKLALLSEEIEFEGLGLLGNDKNTYIIKLGKQNVDVIELKIIKDDVAHDEKDFALKSDRLSKKFEISMPSSSSSSVVLLPPSYQTYLPGPFSELNSLLKEIHVSALGGISELNLETNIDLTMTFGGDEASLKDILKLSDYILKKRLTSMNKFGINLHYRILMQVKELRSQILKLRDEFSDDRLKILQEKTESLGPKLDYLITKQDLSSERLTALLEKIYKLQQLRKDQLKMKNSIISKEEKVWIAQVEQFESRVVALKLKFDDYQQQLKYIKSIVYTNGGGLTSRKSESDTSTSTAPNFDFKRLKNRLLKEKRVIDLVGKTLGDEMSIVDELMADLKI